MEIHERIKKRRKELNLSAENVAHEIGVSRATYYRYESADIEKLSINVLAPLAAVLKTTPAYLMGWDDDSLTATEKDIDNIGNINEKTNDNILKLKPFDNIIDAMVFMKEYNVKFLEGLDIENMTVINIIKLVNSILITTQETIKKERK